MPAKYTSPVLRHTTVKEKGNRERKREKEEKEQKKNKKTKKTREERNYC